MKFLLLALPFLSFAALAQDLPPTEITFTSSATTRDYGLFLVAGEGDCASTRYLVLGDGVQAISQTLSPGESAVLPLGHGFFPGDHALTLSAVGCILPPVAARLVILNQSSPGHARVPQVLNGVEPAT